MSRLVAVSNRISVPRRGAAPGGLAVGLLAAMRARRGMWFGWDGETAETATAEPSVVRKDGVTFASIDFDKSEYQDFYLGFCNGTLWPLFHYFVDGFRYSDAQYEAYQRMNQRYARHLPTQRLAHREALHPRCRPPPQRGERLALRAGQHRMPSGTPKDSPITLHTHDCRVPLPKEN